MRNKWRYINTLRFFSFPFLAFTSDNKEDRHTCSKQSYRICSYEPDLQDELMVNHSLLFVVGVRLLHLLDAGE